MYTTLTTNQIAHELYTDENADWSYNGALALAEYLEEMEIELGETYELDVVALRCDFSEYESAIDACSDYGIDADTEEAAVELLRNETVVLKVSDKCNTVIVQNF